MFLLFVNNKTLIDVSVTFTAHNVERNDAGVVTCVVGVMVKD